MLFIVSYAPLFILIIVKQVHEGEGYLNWGGFNRDSIYLFLEKFGLSAFLGIIIVVGIVGLKIFISNLYKSSDTSGSLINISEVENKNSEAISYIGTYIIPFLFQDYSSWYSLVSLGIVFLVIFFIYINSSLILINPLLNIFCSLYEVKYSEKEGSEPKRGHVITSQKYLEEGDFLMVKNIGHKLFYGKFIEDYVDEYRKGKRS